MLCLVRKSTFDPQATKAAAVAFQDTVLDLNLVGRRRSLTHFIADAFFSSPDWARVIGADGASQSRRNPRR
jgi:hypothetical protein